MVTSVLKASAIENIYKNFYDLVNAITNFSGIVYPAFPYKVIDDKADYPIVVINSPEISWDTFTFGLNLLEGSIDIDIYTTSAKTTDEYSSDVSNQIETSKDTLADNGLRQVHLTSTNTDSASHGKIRVHLKTLNFDYKFYSSKTAAY